MNSAELLPLIGQLAVLSKSAAKSTVALAIVQELVAADTLLRKAGPGKEELASALAGQVKKLGGTNDVIIGELANSVEEMALSAQADSLGKVLRSLGEASTSDSALVPAFDRTLQAGRLGAEKGAPEQAPAERGSLLRAFFSAITPERTNPAASGQAADEFNRAFQALLLNEGLAQTELRTFWKQVVRLLSFSRTQTALAEALALSLTESAIYLSGEERNNLIAACENYPSLAKSLQRQFLTSWRKLWDDLYAKNVKVAEVNARKANVFVPLVGAILGLEPSAIEDEWLRSVVENKLVKDEEIETRFPKLVLHALKKREALVRELGSEPTLEGMLAFSAQAFQSNWTLSTVHIPTLNDWVDRQPE